MREGGLFPFFPFFFLFPFYLFKPFILQGGSAVGGVGPRVGGMEAPHRRAAGTRPYYPALDVSTRNVRKTHPDVGRRTPATWPLLLLQFVPCPRPRSAQTHVQPEFTSVGRRDPPTILTALIRTFGLHILPLCRWSILISHHLFLVSEGTRELTRNYLSPHMIVGDVHRSQRS